MQKKIDDSLVVNENGDTYGFDIGTDVDMYIAKDQEEGFIYSTRETYDVLQYPYKITIAFKYLLLGDVIRDYKTGQLYKIVDYLSNYNSCVGQKLDINLNVISNEHVKIGINDGILSINTSYSYFDILDQSLT